MKTFEQMTRAELLEELRRREQEGVERTLRRTMLELEVYREELRQQNEELVEAQKRLEWSRDRYAELFDSAPVGYVTLDPSGVVEEINLTGARLLGQEVCNVVGRPFLFAVSDSDAFLAHLARCRSGEKLVVSELELQPRSGGHVPVEMRSRPAIREGRVLFMTTLSDLSERRRLEAERGELELRVRVAQEANEAKDRFLAVLSHELRNPLAAIAAGASVLSEASLPAPLADTVERIRRNTFAEARLVTDLLDASRLRHGKLRVEREAVDLHGMIEDTLAGLREDVARPVAVSLEAARHLVSGDPMRLGQVLSNLLRNAQTATAEGGEIRVLTSNPAPDRILLSVIDTGRGIAPADLARIFSPFESVRPSEGGVGLGLGLPISKGLVEAHGGRLEAQSEGPGKGARFDVELPVLASAQPKPGGKAAAGAGPSGLRILLVEDHQDTADSLALLLGQRGFQVTIADSIASALVHAAQGFDVLISDLGLPDGSGRELAQRLAGSGPLRAIALSGYGSDADVRESQRAGFRAHLVKPVEPSTLLRVLARIAAA